ncbi:hypothetical protein K0M31_009487 [Melipona bicolor]|uniref:Transmembrane protein n=1 Tax=Melipona bicolor TaxID=60889 RepID=A0AA40FNT5_9HYME|nr:hypothetical protein K0M31_009487 [Melipona bicolor]
MPATGMQDQGIQHHVTHLCWMHGECFLDERRQFYLASNAGLFLWFLWFLWFLLQFSGAKLEIAKSRKELEGRRDTKAVAAITPAPKLLQHLGNSLVLVQTGRMREEVAREEEHTKGYRSAAVGGGREWG